MTQGTTFEPVVIHCENRETWLQFKAKGIGASEISTVAGLNPYQTPLQLWAVKCELAEPEDLSDNEAVEWGIRLENEIARKFHESVGRSVIDPGEFDIYRHPDHDFALCTPDRFTTFSNGEPAVLEIKTAGAHMEHYWQESAPENYIAQVQWQMFCTGYQYAVIACLIGGRKFVWDEIERCDATIEALLVQAIQFWNMVETREQPTAEFSDTETLKKLFPNVEADKINLDGESLSLDEQIQEAKDEIKKWETIKKTAENRIKQMIGEHEVGVLPNGVSYSWKNQDKKEYTVKAQTIRVLRRKGAK